MQDRLFNYESFMPMKRVSFDEYLEFAERRGFVEVDGERIKLEPVEVKRLAPTSEELTDVSTTVWSFPVRGSWATHKGDYRGNWPPQVPRALILMYTEPGDTVLDPMVGSGTTCIEAKLLGRHCIAVDVNINAVMLTLHRLYWLERHLEKLANRSLDGVLGSSGNGGVTIEDMLKARVEVYHGDARRLDKLAGESVDLIATHPPYYDIVGYGGAPGNLSAARSLEEYLHMLHQVGVEAFRVLKPNHYMGILLGDTRIHNHYVPVTHYALQTLLKAGFILKEEIVKIQHKMKTTREKWLKLKNKSFLLINHEKLFILRKPGDQKEYVKYKYSSHTIKTKGE